jgi:hypothetical protein
MWLLDGGPHHSGSGRGVVVQVVRLDYLGMPADQSLKWLIAVFVLWMLAMLYYDVLLPVWWKLSDWWSDGG